MLITLLKIEWLKVKKYRAFWIIFGCAVLLFPSVTMAFGRLITDLIKNLGPAEQLAGGPFDFNQVFFTSAFLNNGLNIAWGMLLILMIGGEFQNRTIRQNVIDGQERNHIVTSKLILVVIFSIISTLLMLVSSLITGLIFADNSFTFNKDILEVAGTFLFASIMQMMFALIFAFWIKRPALSVIIYLGYTVFVENILVTLLNAITQTNYPRLIFTQAADELTTVAITKKYPIADGGMPSLPPEAPWIACVIYGGAIIFFLYWYINRTILK